MSRLEKALLPVITGEARGARATLLRGVLRGLSGIYLAGIEGYLGCYRLGLLKRTRLACKVICVGNLTVGGTGKTTTVRALARKLMAMGLKVAVLSYGYRSDHDGPPSVVSDGNEILMTPREAGDEAVLLAKDLPGAPVIIGPRRVESGRLAVERFGVDVILMDDGFQYWRLRKDLEILLLDATEPFGYGAVIPRGLLREPIGHLARAGAVIITHADHASPEALEALETRIRRIAPGMPIARSRHAAARLRNLAGDGELSLDWLKGRRVLALSSLGNPGGFERTLAALGAEPVGSSRFRDHHRYSREEIARVREEAAALGAEAVLTTEKDAIKIDKQWLEGSPMVSLAIELEFLSGETEVIGRIHELFAVSSPAPKG